MRRPHELGSRSRRKTLSTKAPRRTPPTEPELRAAAARSSVWQTTPMSLGASPCSAFPGPTPGLARGIPRSRKPLPRRPPRARARRGRVRIISAYHADLTYKSSSAGASPRARARGGRAKVIGVAYHTGIAHKSPSAGTFLRAGARSGRAKVVGVAFHTDITRHTPKRRPPEPGSGSRQGAPGVEKLPAGRPPPSLSSGLQRRGHRCGAPHRYHARKPVGRHRAPNQGSGP